ncbi:MAG: UPF0182 family protein [Clostridia bacterium]|nr:UPF0182 family protein [Clostridia bacterium]MCI9413291.1 UPF0182 family protein [Clostridia bacterium]
MEEQKKLVNTKENSNNQPEEIKENKVQEIAKKEKSKKGKTRKWVVLAFLLLAVMVLYVIYRGEYLETLELGEQYLSIFWQNLAYRFSTFGIIFVLLYFILYMTNRSIKKGLTPFFEQEKKPMPKIPNKSIAFIFAIIISFITTNIIMEKLMLFMNSTAFEITDPVLGYDIGYFIFGQPFIKFLLRYGLFIVVGLTVYAVFYYIIAFNVFFEGVDRETLKKSSLIKLLCRNVTLIGFLIAGYMFIETHNVGLQRFINLNEIGNYALYGAGISEVTIKLWGYRILSILIIIAVISAVRAFKKQNTKRVILSLATVPIYLIAMLLVLVGFEFIFVNSNALDKQQAYIEENINYTKQAYGINIDEINLGENETITSEKVRQNADVINNIAMIDKETVLKNLNTLQTNKGYYTYGTTQIANYRVDGVPQLMYMSPREISSSTRTYNNKTYEYTHGYGVILTSATSVDEKGNLIDIQKDYTSHSDDIISIEQPRIYFGLETNDTVVTNSKEKNEFDYPITESTKAENATNNYDGQAGLSLNFLDRFILGIKEKDLKLAFSGNVDKDSKILINRNIVERAKTLLPYILYDENPYLVTTSEGKLVWVLDGYTTSNNYPYSQRINLHEENILDRLELNYIRNSVKVLIDAYDGTIKFYITDKTDLIIKAYQKMYPDLFVDKEEQIPTDISSQFVYPEFLYSIQAQIMQRYHNIQPDVLYREDDVWEIATHNTSKVLSKTGTQMKPYYTMVKTTNNDKPVLGLVLPYTPYEKQNLTAYLIGTCENGEKKLTLYKYPTGSNVLGPMQIDTQLEQDERISKEIASLNVAGTKISKNMIVVPINNSLLYVETIYQQDINEENSTPMLKKVVVASGNKVAIGNNLKEALENLLSQDAVDIEVESTDTVEQLVQAIVKANGNLKKSNENNNWEMIGKDMNKLQELIDKLEKLLEEQRKENQKNENKNQNDNNVISNNEA